MYWNTQRQFTLNFQARIQRFFSTVMMDLDLSIMNMLAIKLARWDRCISTNQFLWITLIWRIAIVETRPLGFHYTYHKWIITPEFITFNYFIKLWGYTYNSIIKSEHLLRYLVIKFNNIHILSSGMFVSSLRISFDIILSFLSDSSILKFSKLFDLLFHQGKVALLPFIEANQQETLIVR